MSVSSLYPGDLKIMQAMRRQRYIIAPLCADVTNK